MPARSSQGGSARREGPFGGDLDGEHRHVESDHEGKAGRNRLRSILTGRGFAPGGRKGRSRRVCTPIHRPPESRAVQIAG